MSRRAEQLSIRNELTGRYWVEELPRAGSTRALRFERKNTSIKLNDAQKHSRRHREQKLRKRGPEHSMEKRIRLRRPQASSTERKPDFEANSGEISSREFRRLLFETTT